MLRFKCFQNVRNSVLFTPYALFSSPSLSLYSKCLLIAWKATNSMNLLLGLFIVWAYKHTHTQNSISMSKMGTQINKQTKKNRMHIEIRSLLIFFVLFFSSNHKTIERSITCVLIRDFCISIKLLKTFNLTHQQQMRLDYESA